jgi:hypothetical protein
MIGVKSLHGRSTRMRRQTGTPRAVVAATLCAVCVLTAVLVTPASVASARQAASTLGTVWLCRPGMADDPCEASEASTAVSADGSTKASPAGTSTSSSGFDCFYVYPTVSTQRKENANLKVQAGEIGAAVSQASRFSQVCRVWAPMYRQQTSTSLENGLGSALAADQVAYNSLLSGWQDYLAHDNDGRPIIFIGHSQGAAMLIRLLRDWVDPSAALRKQMVVAIILGGNVQVPTGKDVGGSFARIPTCGSAHATGCVIAYSTFGTEPPPTADFGRPGQGVSLQSFQNTSEGEQVACVNPVNFSKGPASLLPYFLRVTTSVPGTTVDTPWVSFPGLYTAKCVSKGGATWLQVTPTAIAGDVRPTVTASIGPDWGYHVDDVNLALGNLVNDVRQEETAYHP